jgi:predicted DCC family thiol-disulfide oxidoreductase YuxK
VRELNTAQLTLLYDEDCNFCKVIVDALLTWDRAGSLRALAIQSVEGQRLLAPVPAQRRLDSFHLVAPDGSIRSGGPAMSELFGTLPAAGPLAAAFERLPSATSAGYDWVARNRVAISRFVPGVLKRRADRRLRQRRARSGLSPTRSSECTGPA